MIDDEKLQKGRMWACCLSTAFCCSGGMEACNSLSIPMTIGKEKRPRDPNQPANWPGLRHCTTFYRSPSSAQGILDDVSCESCGLLSIV
jgi:hypothetical protein